MELYTYCFETYDHSILSISPYIVPPFDSQQQYFVHHSKHFPSSQTPAFLRSRWPNIGLLWASENSWQPWIQRQPFPQAEPGGWLVLQSCATVNMVSPRAPLRTLVNSAPVTVLSGLSWQLQNDCMSPLPGTGLWKDGGVPRGPTPPAPNKEITRPRLSLFWRCWILWESRLPYHSCPAGDHAGCGGRRVVCLPARDRRSLRTELLFTPVQYQKWLQLEWN